jgi:nicotinate-nucleotide adenylyltransferase
LTAPGAAVQRRIGVFGGSFDPPHNAHVALASAAIGQLALDALHIVPTGSAWHKSRPLSDAKHRLEMARLAFSGMPKVLVDERELLREGPSFTIDTLNALQAENPGAALHLIIGADQFASFRQWHRWEDVLACAIICIADRGGSTPDRGLIDGLMEGYEGTGGRFIRLQLPLMPVSATRIRQLMASGASGTGEIARLVPEAVARYISLHKLYAPA